MTDTHVTEQTWGKHGEHQNDILKTQYNINQ